MHSLSIHQQLRSQRMLQSDNVSRQRILRKKRIRKGGPSAIPPTWRNHPPKNLVMSFASPEVQDGHIIVVLQSSSQLPAFGRYSIPVATNVREDRILDNPIDNEHLWSPITNSHWEPCRKKKDFAT